MGILPQGKVWSHRYCCTRGPRACAAYELEQLEPIKSATSWTYIWDGTSLLPFLRNTFLLFHSILRAFICHIFRARRLAE